MSKLRFAPKSRNSTSSDFVSRISFRKFIDCEHFSTLESFYRWIIKEISNYCTKLVPGTHKTTISLASLTSKYSRLSFFWFWKQIGISINIKSIKTNTLNCSCPEAFSWPAVFRKSGISRFRFIFVLKIFHRFIHFLYAQFKFI